MALEAPLPQEADWQEGGDTLRKGSGDVQEATVPSIDLWEALDGTMLSSPGW